jgi:hypothetical protein
MHCFYQKLGDESVQRFLGGFAGMRQAVRRISAADRDKLCSDTPKRQNRFQAGAGVDNTIPQAEG